MRHQMRSLLLRGVASLLARGGEAPSPAPSRILLIRPDHLGDVLFLTPALHALREACPDATLTVLVGPWAAGILASNPDLDAVETLPFPWFDRKPKAGLLDPYQRLYQAAATLRGRFDCAILCRFDHWWGAWLAAAAGIPRIIGYNTPDVAPFLTEKIPYTPGQHEVLQNLTLLESLGVRPALAPTTAPLRYVVSEEHRRTAQRVLAAGGLAEGTGPLVAIHPGSGALVKRWQVERWTLLMEQLRTTAGACFVITGGPDERELASQVAQAVSEQIPTASVAGQTSLPELAALFERCALVIGPDSGPLHLAVAMGRPTIHLYGPVDPRTFGPWGNASRHRVVSQSLACQFCNRLDWSEAQLSEHPCVSHISVRQVADAAIQLLTRKEYE